MMIIMTNDDNYDYDDDDIASRHIQPLFCY